jgi:hypothetical protein
MGKIARVGHGHSKVGFNMEASLKTGGHKVKR